MNPCQRLRKKHNLTQEELACVIGCGVRSVQRIEAGEVIQRPIMSFVSHLTWLDNNAPEAFYKYLRSVKP